MASRKRPPVVRTGHEAEMRIFEEESRPSVAKTIRYARGAVNRASRCHTLYESGEPIEDIFAPFGPEPPSTPTYAPMSHRDYSACLREEAAHLERAGASLRRLAKRR